MKCWKCGADQEQKLDDEIVKAVRRCIELCEDEERRGKSFQIEVGSVILQIKKEFNLES